MKRMKAMTNRVVTLQIGALLGFAVLLGCMGGQGSTDGGSAENPNFADDQFVAGDDTTGSMKLVLSQESISVGDTASFTVHVQNASGAPVSNINVACDSESGVAIVEPQRGYEMTGSSGTMSGVIGCERPGSFQMVCRLSVGANRRKFVGVKCTGDVPAGFQGFPGAGGGGLGGGVQNNDDGDVRIVEAGFSDDNNTSQTGSSIDIAQDSDCDNDSNTVDIEPFFDTYVTLKVENNLAEQVRFEYLQYTIDNVDGQGTEFTSKRLGLTQETNSSASGSGGTASITLPIFKAYGGGKFVGDPVGVGLQITNSALLTVSFSLVGQTSSGDPIEVTARATASFGSFNRCTSSAS